MNPLQIHRYFSSGRRKFKRKVRRLIRKICRLKRKVYYLKERNCTIHIEGRRKSLIDKHVINTFPTLDCDQSKHHEKHKRSSTPVACEGTTSHSLMVLCSLQMNSTRNDGLDPQPHLSKVRKKCIICIITCLCCQFSHQKVDIQILV